MKKRLKLILIVLNIFILSACGNIEVNNNSDVQVINIDCNEYDIQNQKFVDNILISFNLTDEFIKTEQELLNVQGPNYVIGEYKRNNDKNELERTILIYECTDIDINDYIDIGHNWYINNHNLDTDVYSKIFYTKVDDYIIGVSIINNNKNALSIEDATSILTFMTNLEFTIDNINNTEEKEEEVQNHTVAIDGTLQNPATLGDWVNTAVYNPYNNKYEPVCVSITALYTGDVANKYIMDYNNIHHNNGDELELMYNGSSQFIVYEYSIYFPTDFACEDTINNITLPIQICNTIDDGNGIMGYLNLNNNIHDISNEMIDVKPGTIWNGIGVAEVPDGAQYYLKFEVKDQLFSTQYFMP